MDICKYCGYSHEDYSGRAAECDATRVEQLETELERQKNISANMEKCYLAEYNKHRWIPVSERLPWEKGRYFICEKDLHELRCRELWFQDGKWFHGNKTSLYSSFGTKERITHWKPIILPEGE